MTLNKSKLIEDLKAIFTIEQLEEKDANKSIERLSEGFANAFEAFVKSGEVNTTVQTTGTATAQTGTGTGKVT